MHAKVVGSIVALTFLLLSQSSQAQIETQWIGNDGVWSESSNWSNGVPFGNFNATLGSNAGVVTQDMDSLLINGLVYDSPTGNLTLDERLSILSNLNWTGGAISGAESIDFFGDGILTEVLLETTFRNFGRMEIGDPIESTQLQSTTANAHWINKSGSEMVFNHGTVVGSFSNNQAFQGMITNEAEATMCIFNSANYILWDTINDGVIEIGEDGGFAGALFIKKFTQSASGEVRLNGGFIDFFDEVNFAGKVSGSGSLLNLSSTFDGELSPGGSELGTIDVAGALIMVPETTTRMQLGANLQSDRITNIGGPLQLNGVLDLEATPGTTTGNYTLFQYNNASGLDISGISFGEVPFGFNGSLEIDQPNKQVLLIVDAIDDVVGIDSIKAITGIVSSGNVEDLAINDEQKIELSQNNKLKSGTVPVSFVAEATLPDAASTDLRVRIDSSANNPRLQQQVALFDFDSGQFELIGSSLVTRNDQTIDFEVAGDASRFVDEDGVVSIRVEYVPSVRRNVNWIVSIDQLNVIAGQ